MCPIPFSVYVQSISPPQSMRFLKTLCMLTCSNLFRLTHSLGASSYLHELLLVVNSIKLHMKVRKVETHSFTECMPYLSIVVVVVVVAV